MTSGYLVGDRSPFPPGQRPSEFQLRNQTVQGTRSDIGPEPGLLGPYPVVPDVFAVGQVFNGEYKFPGGGGELQTSQAGLDFQPGIGTVIPIAAVEQVFLADAVNGGQIAGVLQ